MLKFYTNKISTMLITIILNKINYYSQSLWNAADAQLCSILFILITIIFLEFNIFATIIFKWRWILLEDSLKKCLFQKK